MNNNTYTQEGMHPEDAIHKAKVFINELEEVQTSYFDKLAYSLKLNKEGEEFLFDYIYNCYDEVDDFTHYLQAFKKTYEDMVQNDTMFNNPAETLLSTDFGEFSPMLDMSSYEPDLDTAFPPAYNDKEPFTLGLDNITVKHSKCNIDTI
jgi:hypothetical protein